MLIVSLLQITSSSCFVKAILIERLDVFQLILRLRIKFQDVSLLPQRQSSFAPEGRKGGKMKRANVKSSMHGISEFFA